MKCSQRVTGQPVRTTGWLRSNMLLVIALLDVGWLVSLSFAGTGGNLSLPMPGMMPKPRNRSGVTLSLDTNWVESSGYRPVRLEVRSTIPSLRERRFRVRIQPFEMGGNSSRSECELVLPEGATSASKVIPVPQRLPWHSVRVETSEDGQPLDDLTYSVGLVRTVSNWGWSEGLPSIVWIDRDAPLVNASAGPATVNSPPKLPDVRNLTLWLPSVDGSNVNAAATQVAEGNTTDAGAIAFTQLQPRLMIVPFSEVTSPWIHFSSVDFVFISFEDLQKLTEENPQTVATLRDYVCVGGTLIVMELGSEWQAKLPLIDQWVLGETTTPSDQSNRAWRDLSPQRFGHTVDTVVQSNAVVRSYDASTAETTESFDEASKAGDATAATAPPDSGMRLRRAQFGHIVGVQAANVGDVGPRGWGWLLTELSPSQWRWFGRTGLSLNRANSEYWTWMIPGIGAAPVRSFLAIITCFMLAIGPVSYYFLNRWRRLYWLLFTVPVGASLITAMLFAYALVHDGLGTHARLRSITQVTADGYATSWSRQTYYAGLTPSAGMRYPTSAVVLPLHAAPPLNTSGQLDWSDEQQTLRGYLPARVVTQFVVANATKVNPPVAFTATTSGQAPSAKNRLGVPLDHLLVLDGEQCYWSDHCDAETTVSLVSMAREEAAKRLRAILDRHLPTLPQGMAAAPSVSQFYNGYNYLAYNTRDANFSDVSQSEGLLERSLARLLPLPQNGRFYIGVTSLAPETVPVGVTTARQEAGFHVIHGTW